MNTLDQYLFRLELSLQRGRHTELVSLYVQKGRVKHEVLQKIQFELNESKNIKDSENRKAVRNSLEKISSAVKAASLENGGAVFSNGDRTWTLTGTADAPFRDRGYLCEKFFWLKPLEKRIFGTAATVGMLLLDTHDGILAMAEGNKIRVLKIFTGDMIPSKTCKGGSSAKRYTKVIQKASEQFYAKFADKAHESFFDIRHQLTCILLGGCYPGVSDFMNADFLTPELKKMVKGPFTVQDVDSVGLTQLLKKASGVLQQLSQKKEENTLDQFIKLKQSRRAFTGLGSVSTAAQQDKSLKLLMTDEFFLVGASINKMNVDTLKTWLSEGVTNFRIIASDSPLGRLIHHFDGIAAVSVKGADQVFR